MTLIHRIAISNGDKERKEIANKLISAMDHDKIAEWNLELQINANDKAASYYSMGDNCQVEHRLDFDKPNRCVICGNYLTISGKYVAHRCLDPSHWQAIGLLAPNDFYLMACLTAKRSAEPVRRSEVPDSCRARQFDGGPVFKPSPGQKQTNGLRRFG